MQHLPELNTPESLMKGLITPYVAATTTDRTNFPIANAPSVRAYADGSCLGNPGPGGWAYAIVNADGTRQTSSGAIKRTTNNQAELMGATEALKAMPGDAAGTLHLDSEYIVKAVNEWRSKWERNGWRSSKGGPVVNAELFKALFALVDARPGVKLKWVRAHAGDATNELVDRIARTEAERAQHGYGLR